DHDRRQRFHRTGGIGHEHGGPDPRRVYRGGVHGDVRHQVDSAPRQLGEVGRWVSGVLLLVAVLAFAGAVAGAGTASAFTFPGESVVLNPAKTDLTGPAKTILENPTFLPDSVDGAAALGGADEATAAAGVFEASTLLPALSAFGVGAVVG